MTHVEPLIADRPEFANTQSEPRALSHEKPRPSMLARIKQDPKPFIVGVGVGASVALVLARLTSDKQPLRFTLFPEARSTALSGLAKIAILAIGRTVVRRAFTRAVVQAAKQPA